MHYTASVGVRRISAPRHFMVFTFSPDIFLRSVEGSTLLRWVENKPRGQTLYPSVLVAVSIFSAQV